MKEDTTLKINQYINFGQVMKKNIYFIRNQQISDLGAIELVKIDGKKYTVSVLYASTITDKDYMQDAVNYLTEFNQKNNITPIAT